MVGEPQAYSLPPHTVTSRAHDTPATRAAAPR